MGSGYAVAATVTRCRVPRRGSARATVVQVGTVRSPLGEQGHRPATRWSSGAPARWSAMVGRTRAMAEERDRAVRDPIRPSGSACRAWRV